MRKSNYYRSAILQSKGDFDFIWKTFEDYLQEVEKWAKRNVKDF
jgi:hypothetical protein